MNVERNRTKDDDKEDVTRDEEPGRPPVRGEVVYGDTDLDPNRDDQASAHRATEDEHL